MGGGAHSKSSVTSLKCIIEFISTLGTSILGGKSFFFFFHKYQWICPLCSLICGPSTGVTEAVQILNNISLAKIKGISKWDWSFNLDLIRVIF